MGAGPGEGELPFEEGSGAGRADAEDGALLVGGAPGAGPVAGSGQRGAGQGVQRFEEPVQPGRVGVFPGQGAREPGQFGAELLGPGGVQRCPEGVQRAADPARGAAQRGGGLLGPVAPGVRGSAVLAVQAQAAEEFGGLLLKVGREDRARRKVRLRRLLVMASHAGASGRQ